MGSTHLAVLLRGGSALGRCCCCCSCSRRCCTCGQGGEEGCQECCTKHVKLCAVPAASRKPCCMQGSSMHGLVLPVLLAVRSCLSPGAARSNEAGHTSGLLTRCSSCWLHGRPWPPGCRLSPAAHSDAHCCQLQHAAHTIMKIGPTQSMHCTAPSTALLPVPQSSSPY